MKSLLVVLFGIFVGVFSEAPLYAMNEPTKIPGQYHIVFHENVSADARSLFVSSYGSNVMHTFDIGDFHGMAANLSSSLLKKTLSSPHVKYVEAVLEVHALQSCEEQKGATWGLDRIGERELNLDEIYHYPGSSGEGTQAFIIDTGIEINHIDFGGRASRGFNFADNNPTDCNGHGTHVAGTVGGSVHGVAKKTSLIAVKVLNCAGSGTNANVVKGIQWAAQNKKNKPSVANMSLGGAYSKTTNDAVDNAVKSGVVFVVAAGNDNKDACNYSPASAPEAISVGATTVEGLPNQEKDVRTSFSNYGSCVDVLAPGELITSAWIGTTNGKYDKTRTISGTSMAAPHVAGVVALYLGENPSKSPAQVLEFIDSEASDGLVNLLCNNNVACKATPNRLLFSPC